MDVLLKFRYYFLGNVGRFISAPFVQYEISPEEACTILGCRFGNGWHHIVETLKEYDSNPQIHYKDTSVYSFLKTHEIASISDLIDDATGKKIQMFNFPWGKANKKLDLGNKNIWNSRFCGPSTDAFIQNEFNEIINLYNSLKSEGYKPYKYPNSFIIGTWLTNISNDSVFMVLGGNHRMAILSHLGYRKIRVRTHKSLIRRVTQKEIDSWPLVREGICSSAYALKIFNIYFEQNGKHVQKILKKSYGIDRR